MGNNLNQRDVIAVRKTTSGLLKLLFPHGEFKKEDVRLGLEYALQVPSAAKEKVKIAFDFFKANAARISAGTKVNDHDFTYTR